MDTRQQASAAGPVKRLIRVIVSGVAPLSRFSDLSDVQVFESDKRSKILGAEDVVDVDANAAFVARCQFKFGGLAKVPDERPGQCFYITLL